MCVYLELNKYSSLSPGHTLASLLSPQAPPWSDMEQAGCGSRLDCHHQNPTCMTCTTQKSRFTRQKTTSRVIYESFISIPEGDWQGDVHFDPEGVEVSGIHSYELPDKQELWLSQWGHFICSQEDLLALGAHRVGCCYLA